MAEKKIKEATIVALPPVEDVPKKRGRKPKEQKTEIVSHETFGISPEQIQGVAEEISNAIDKTIIEDLVSLGEAKTVNIPEVKELSIQAEGWRKWLSYQRMTPEDFLKRYPTHKMIHHIKEIIAFNAQK